jgi:hypothetical protein
VAVVEGIEETGHVVVERIIVSVVKWPLPGQWVTLGAQEVTVYTRVVRTVETVNSTLEELEETVVRGTLVEAERNDELESVVSGTLVESETEDELEVVVRGAELEVVVRGAVVDLVEGAELVWVAV